jgi:hypothetical protein
MDVLRWTLLLIGGLLLNPFLPTFGLQLAVSVAIGMLLPQRIIEPVNHILHRIPVVKNVVRWFEDKLRKKRRLRTTIPRVLVGYCFTSLLSIVAIFISYLF